MVYIWNGKYGQLEYSGANKKNKLQLVASNINVCDLAIIICTQVPYSRLFSRH